MKLDRPSLTKLYKWSINCNETINDEFIINKFIIGGKLRFNSLIHKYSNREEICQYLENRYTDKENTSFSEIIYRIYHKLDNLPVCKMCGNPVKYWDFDFGYSRFCSQKCSANSPEVKSKISKLREENPGIFNCKQEILQVTKLQTPKSFKARYSIENNIVNDEFILSKFVINNRIKFNSNVYKYSNRYEILKYLENRYTDKEPQSFEEVIYRLYYDIDVAPKCKMCNNFVKFRDFYWGYATYCSGVCANSDPDKTKKQQDTCLKRYGVKSAFHKGPLRDKMEDEREKRTGYRNCSQDPKIKEKKKETCRKNYGVDYPMQSPVVRQKSEEKCLEVYGVRIISQSPEIQQRNKDNYKEKTGYDNPMQNPEVLAKFNWDEMVKHQHETKRRTGNWGSQVSESELRIKEVLISKYGENDVKDQYSDVRYPFNCDFYIPSLDLFIEYNGHPSHGDKPYNNTVEDNELISIWESNKSKRIQKYKHVFCHTDIGKLEIAKANKIKLVVFNTVAEAVYCINNNIYDVIYNKYEYSTNKLEEFIEENLHKEKVNFSDKKFIQKYTTIVNTKFGLPFGVYDFSNDKSFNKVKLENQDSVD